MHSLLGLNSWSSRCSLALLSIQWLVREVSLYWSNSYLILQAQHSKIFGMILHVYCEEYFFILEALIIDCYLWFDCWRWEWLSSICWWRVSLVTTDNSMKKYEVILRRDTEDDTEDDINSCVKDDTCDKASSRVQWRNCNVVTGSWAYP